MKHYYRHYYRNFSNTFELISVDSKEENGMLDYFWKRDKTASTVERIPLKTALHLCAAERKLRKVNPEAAGYAPTEIIPWDEYLKEEREEREFA